MRKITLIFLVFILTSFVIGCKQSETNEKNTNTSNAVKEDKKNEAEKKVFGANEEAFITNEDGENIYSLIINSAEIVEMDADYEEYMPNNSKHVLALTYTYNFIQEKEGVLEELIIYPWDMQVYDENNLAIDLIDVASGDYPFDSDSIEINAGRSAQTHNGYALKNDTSVIQVDFNSELFGQKLTFEIPVEK